MNPAELLQLLAGLTQHAEQLSFERQFVDAPRKRIGTVQHLIRTGRNADRPRGAWCKRAGGYRGFIGNVADRGLSAGRDRYVDRELPLEITLAVENLNATIAAIGNIHEAFGIDSDTVRRMKLTRVLHAEDTPRSRR